MTSTMTGDTDWLEWYCAWLRAAGRSPRTIYARRRQALALARDVDPRTATLHDLAVHLGNPAWSPATKASVRAGLHTLFGWLVAAGLRDDDPSTLLPAIRQPPPHPHPASEQSLARARALAATPHERLMVELAARAGLRRAEIACLRFSDLRCQPDGQYCLEVCGKGRRTRTVPIPLDLAHMILDLRTDHIFPGRFAGRHMSPNWVGARLSVLLGPEASAHHLRHRYATRIYSATHDLLAVQQLLGHSSPTTTQAYIGQDSDDLRRAALAAS